MNSDEERTNTEPDQGYIRTTFHSACCLARADYNLSAMYYSCSNCGKMLAPSDLISEQQAAEQSEELNTLATD